MSQLPPGYALLDLLPLIAAFLAGIVVGRITAATALPRPGKPDRKQRPDMATSDMLALLPAETRFEIETLVADGRKIEAIRVCRAAIGLGLKEAKDVIDLVDAASGRGARAP
jgi:ribosomal protein L7/L12